jgi:S-DNA-T family DNA segregation ATPase FtsK/SpoIIIE
MSAEQRDNNLGIDPELRNNDQGEHLRRLREIRERQEAGLTEFEPEAGFVFVVVAGPDLGRSIPLGAQPVSIGRGRDDTLQLRDAGMTRCQLVVQWNPDGQQHWLCQSGDSPTLVNGVPVPRNADVRHALADGDQIAIGSTVLRYQRGKV